MSTAVQRRGGTTAEHSTFAGLNREITIDTTKGTVVVHNGTTAGGLPLLREDGSNSALALGSASAPSVKFVGDTNTGIYSPGADQVAISTGGTARLTATTTALSATLPIDHPLGSASAPTVTFTGDLNTGIYSPGADQVAISTGGTGRLIVDSSGRLLVGFSSTSGLQAGARHAFSDGSGAAYSGVFVGNPGGGFDNVDINITAWTGSGSNYFTSKIRQVGGVGALAFFTQGTSSADGSGSTTERMRLDSSGRLLIGTTTANTSGAKLQTSDGITFPATQVASTDPNTLDDYEEGTWTPAYQLLTTDFDSVTYNTQSGVYTKVGNIVTVSCRIVVQAFTLGSGTGNLAISGLPFLIRNVSAQSTGTAITQGSGWTNHPFAALAPANTSRLSLFVRSTANGVPAEATQADLPSVSGGGNRMIVNMSATYCTA